LKTAWSRRDTKQRWCAICGTTRSTDGQSSDIHPEGSSNNITVVDREIFPRKATKHIDKFEESRPRELLPIESNDTTCLKYDVSDEVLEVTNDK